jgi:hypothetical protein
MQCKYKPMHCGLLGCDTLWLVGGYYTLSEEHIAAMYTEIILWSQYVQQNSTYLLDRLNDEVSQIKHLLYKFHHQIFAQYVYIYCTQILHILAIYIGHLQEVTSLVSLYSIYGNLS